MKERKPQKQLLQLVMLTLLSVVSVLVMANESFAALDCTACHGTSGVSLRPLDTTPATAPSSYRNITTGAFKGNHSTHLGATPAATNCAICHNNSGYTSSHRDGGINMAANINASPATATYGSKGIFFNQTSVPTLQTCSSVNCHFETITPAWGSDPAATDCDSCHSSLPTSGSHAKHEAQYGGTASCTKCHAARPNFQHATSAGNAGRNIDLSQQTGTYVGSNFRYLPSQTGRLFGQCSTNYCHSSGQSFNGASATPTYKAGPVWGVNGSIACSSCHEANLLNTGSHSKHIVANNNCGNCHTGATAATMVSATHVDGLINVDGSFAVGYSQGTSSARGNSYGTCSAASCHSATTAAAPVTPAWGTAATCSSCHAASPVSGAHTLHVAMSAVTCDTCHTAASAATHIDGSINVIQMAAPVAKHAPGVYAATCTTVCHSTDTTAVATPSWGAQSTCTSCHALSPTTGAHTTHLTAIVGASCGTCHTGAVQGSNAGANHGNTLIDVTQYSAAVAKHAPGVFAATCSTACHNATGTTAVTTTSWGVVSTCATCHAASPVTGDHTKHLAAVVGATCASCHTGATAGVTGGNGHGDGNIDVAQGYTANKTKGSAYSTCTTTCHNAYSTSVGLLTPTWGTAATCASCHAATPATGAHATHLTAIVGANCGSCHTGATAGVTGGNSHGDGNIDVAAGYTNNNAAKHTGAFTGTCSTSCHNATGTTAVATPSWGVVTTCASCHAASPVTGDHTKHLTAPLMAISCSSCHTGATAGVTGGNGHGDGTIDVAQGYTPNKTKGSAYTTCTTTCHSTSLTAVATPVWGSAASCSSCHATSPATGAHSQHLLGTQFKTISCGDCHTGAVAGSNAGTSHMDGNIDVSVAGYGSNIAKHAVGTYTGNCSTAYCHGSTLPADAVTPKVVPAWGATITGCTACHGNPPVSTYHTGVVANTCNQCHPNVNSNNTFNTPQQHVDGIVQGGECNSCHGYPPVQSMTGLGTNANYSTAKLQNYSGGGGVHSVAGHLAMTLKTSQYPGTAGFTPCLTCHPQGTHNQAAGSFLTANVQVVVDPQFKFDKNRPIVYNAKQSGTGKTSGTCANVSCHFQKSPIWSSQPYTQGH